jgi:hypothetical protein
MAKQTVTITGLQEALDSLTVFQRARIPGSIAWTLNKFAVELREHEMQRMQYTFNKLNKFTQNAPLYKLATKQNPKMTFFLRDNAPGGNSPDRYLAPQVLGGPVYVTRFSRALQRSGAIDEGATPEKGQYALHWGTSKFRPTPGFISALTSALAVPSGPIKSGRQYARNVKARSDFFIKRADKGQGPAIGIFKRKGRGLERVYAILSEAPKVEAKYDWNLERMSLMAEDRIPILLFGKLSEF